MSIGFIFSVTSGATVLFLFTRVLLSSGLWCCGLNLGPLSLKNTMVFFKIFLFEREVYREKLRDRRWIDINQSTVQPVCGFVAVLENKPGTLDLGMEPQHERSFS